MFKHPRWVKNLCQSIWDYRILYADRSSEDEKLSKGHFLFPPPPKKTMVGTWNLKF
jgi:hypothetical protein